MLPAVNSEMQTLDAESASRCVFSSLLSPQRPGAVKLLACMLQLKVFLGGIQVYMIPGRGAQNKPNCIPFLMDPHRDLAMWSLPTNRRGLRPGPEASDANCLASPLLQACCLYSRFPLGRSNWSSPSRD